MIRIIVSLLIATVLYQAWAYNELRYAPCKKELSGVLQGMCETCVSRGGEICTAAELLYHEAHQFDGDNK